LLLNVARAVRKSLWIFRAVAVKHEPCFEPLFLLLVAGAAVEPRSGGLIPITCCIWKGLLRAIWKWGRACGGIQLAHARYCRYEELLKLPQETYTVSDDSTFRQDTDQRGRAVPLTELAKLLGKQQDDLLIVAICYDKYP